MDAAATPAGPVRVNRFLPYWAVLQSDFKQTFNSWIYRVWVLASFGAAAGYLLYRFGATRVSGMVQSAPEMVGDLLNWVVFGSLTLIIALTSGAICAERGTMADSVLSRGISRYQYFLGKWHARLLLVLATYLVMCSVAILGAVFLLNSEALTLHGSVVTMLTVGALLVAVITYGVSVSAVSSNTIVSIAVVWISLYGLGFALSFLPEPYPSPDRALQKLPDILKGYYDVQAVTRLGVTSLCVSLAAAIVGMVAFSRRDV